jgi:DNA ligase 1
MQKTRRFYLQTLAATALGAWLTPLRALAKTTTGLVLLAKEYRGGVDVSRYWVSEKYDGVRAVWDGSVLKFRSGLPIAAPVWFTAQLTATPLDGELWLARGKFDALSGIVRRTQPLDDEWRMLTYWIFELPGAPGSFTQRVARMREVVLAAQNTQLKATEQFKIANEKALSVKLAEVTKAGAEGLVLHLADAPYTVGRSDVLLKYKHVFDGEAHVVAHLPGRGKYAGMTGALRVQTEDGHNFKLGTGLTDAQRKSPPPIGSTVTYTYRDTTPAGKPRFARFLRVREGV